MGRVATAGAVANGLVAAFAVYYLWLVPRADLPSHMLANPCVHTSELLTVDQTRQLMDVTMNQVGSFDTNARASIYKNITYEHVGEARPLVNGRCEHPLTIPSQDKSQCVLPGRVDIALHWLKHGGPNALKEGYAGMISRVQSFGEFIYDLDKYPIIRELFEASEFQTAAKQICPKSKQLLDPLQFNIIVNVPGQTVATHIDSVHFFGATRKRFPEWLLAAMAFSGLYHDRFVDQVQTVAYFHSWTEESRGLPEGSAGGEYVFYELNGPPLRHPPDPRGAVSLDGTKVVHAANTFFPGSKAPTMDKSKHNKLTWVPEEGKWHVTSDGEVIARYDNDEVRFSIVYRARCFESEAERDRYYNEANDEHAMQLEDILETLAEDLARRGRYASAEEALNDDRLDFALTVVDEYIKYPLPYGMLPYNYCAMDSKYPALKPVANPCGVPLNLAINDSLPPTDPKLLCMVLTKYPGSVRRRTADLESWMHACDERAFLVAQTGREVPPARFVTGGSHTYEDGSGKEKKGFALYPGTEARVLSINVTGSGTDCSGNNEECWKKGFLWRKMWQLYLAVYDEYVAGRVGADGGWSQTPEWFIKADDDSFVFVSHLKALITERGLNPDDEHYMGHALTHNLKRGGKDARNGFVSGTCLIMSRGAFRKLVEQALAKIPERTAAFAAEGLETSERQKRCVDRLGPQEDWSTGFCFEDVGILAEDLRDDEGRPLSLPFLYADHLMHRWGGDPSSNHLDDLGFKPGGMLWYWHDKSQHIAGLNCCPPLDKLISIHSFKGEENIGKLYEMRKVEEALWAAKQKAIAPFAEACERQAHSQSGF